MNADPTDPKAEIVIVRRNSGGGDDGHHGGAWKIAYADFVTAMMAFFLVMWLINASNEATRAQVASYFNPIKLTDSSTAKRGLTEPKETLKKKQNPSGGDAEIEGAEKASEMALAQEDKLLHDPHRILASLAAKDQAGEKIAVAEEEALGGTEPAPSAEAFDPFDPQTWQAKAIDEKPPEPKAVVEAESEDIPLPPAEHTAEAPLEPEAVKPEEQAEVADPPAKLKPEIENPEVTPAAMAADVAADEPKPEEAMEAVKPEEKKPSAKTIAAADVIRAEILSRFGAGDQPLPANLDVKPTFEGVLISLTDKQEFGMFALGSAEPDPKMVTLVSTIATVLKEKQGFVVVRGHTDSRPYKNKKYDNWQLSTARAHMAVYMLERGGLMQARVKRVEGYADRDLKDPANPESEANRRIDILLGGLSP